ncbi:MAG: ABC transporter ATP-binding protein [Desulfohalobiaceae bacterium]
MSAEEAISLQGVSFAYERQNVLDGISFQVRKGDFLAVLGPNGSGKSTLLKAMDSQIQIQQGSISLLGRDIQEYSARELAREVALVPQQSPAASGFTVQETVLMGRFPYQGLLGLEGRRDLEVARQAMQSTKVEHLRKRKLNQLSGGELQRVFLARALCQEPRIILLDEPTSSLDPAHQVRIMDLLERLHQEQELTVIMVVHDLNLAALYAQQMLLMREGRAFCQGRPQEVLNFKNLEQVFDCVLLVEEGSMDGLPRVSLVPGRYLDQDLLRRFRAASSA